MTLHIDIETFSSVDIFAGGIYPYAESEDFEILLFAYSIDLQPVRIIDLASGEQLPEAIINAIKSDKVLKIAHNAQFERTCLSKYLGCQLSPKSWQCTMIMSYRLGLPGSLSDVAIALNFEEGKMSEGKNLIKLFCSPKGGRNRLFGDISRVQPSEAPQEWQTFKKYCVRDVEVERHIYEILSIYEIAQIEKEGYIIDQVINDRGVKIDRLFVSRILELDAQYREELMTRARTITGLSNPNSKTQLKAWFSMQIGYDLDKLTKETLKEIRSKKILVNEMIEIAKELGKSSVTKYQRMIDAECNDSRIRGLFQYYGAKTGRWAGRLVQMHNLPRNYIKDLDKTREVVRHMPRALDYLKLTMHVEDTFSQLIRTAFIVEEGHSFVVCDFSAIEARVLAWVAGENWVLDVFRNNGDIYCETASQMFGVPVSKKENYELRQKGKIAVLALGYGGSVGALESMGATKMGIKANELSSIVSLWRKANPNIVVLWKTLEGWVKLALKGLLPRETPMIKQLKGVGIDIFKKDNFLFIRLPSGRCLSYPEMRLNGDSLEYSVFGKGKVVDTTHGGKLVENIIQAIARDCLLVTMQRIEQANYMIVAHVHDEVICEVATDKSEKALEEIKEIFKEPIEWAKNLPLKGEGFISKYYKKD